MRRVPVGRTEAVRMRTGNSGMPADGPAPAEHWDSPLPMESWERFLGQLMGFGNRERMEPNLKVR